MRRLCVSLDSVVVRKDMLGQAFTVLKVITLVHLHVTNGAPLTYYWSPSMNLVNLLHTVETLSPLTPEDTVPIAFFVF